MWTGNSVYSVAWSCRDGCSQVLHPLGLLVWTAGGDHQTSAVGVDSEAVCRRD